jgi:hypothetical protein
MDPNETLRMIRENVQEAMNLDESGRNALDVLVELADAFDSLDTWLTSGGFQPMSWQQQY